MNANDSFDPSGLDLTCDKNAALIKDGWDVRSKHSNYKYTSPNGQHTFKSVAAAWVHHTQHDNMDLEVDGSTSSFGNAIIISIKVR